MTRPSWPRIALVTVLVAAFLVQATSTWKLGDRQHLDGVALPALVVLLEVGSITTAAIFFSARSTGVRVRALLLLAVTATLGGVGGVAAYGFIIGIPVAILLLGLVEVVGAYSRESTSATTVDQSSTASTWVTVPRAGPEPSTGGDEAVDEPRKSRNLGLVYRLWSKTDDLLYIGSCGNGLWLKDRLGAHRAKAWGDEIEYWTTEEHPTRDLAYAAELTAICAERPKYNLQRYSGFVRADVDPAPFVEPCPTEPLPRLVDTVPADVRNEPEPPTGPETEAQAAVRLISAGRATERQLLDALQAEGFEATRYRVKKYLGNATRRLEAVG